MPKPKVLVDNQYKCIRIENFKENEITITEAHSFLKDLVSAIYDYHKAFPEEKVGDYIKNKLHHSR